MGAGLCSPCSACEGKPVVAVDLGGNRSWSAACGIWPTGRIESWASAPGEPSLSDPRASRSSCGWHLFAAPRAELVKSGGLSVDAGRAVPSVERLLSRIWTWEPLCIVSDPYRSAELAQAVAGRCRIVERARSGGEATSNIQSLRSLLLDSNAGVVSESRALLGAAFQQTDLVIDSAGLTKLKKRDQRRSRDDASAALLLAAGELARRPPAVELRAAFVSRDGQVQWI